MATTLETVARNAACNAVVDLLDGGTIELQTAGNVEVATITMGTPAFGAAATGVATLNATTADASATGGTATKAVFKTAATAAVFTVSVGATGSGADIIFPSNVITAGEEINISSYTHTQPAS